MAFGQKLSRTSGADATDDMAVAARLAGEFFVRGVEIVARAHGGDLLRGIIFTAIAVANGLSSRKDGIQRGPWVTGEAGRAMLGERAPDLVAMAWPWNPSTGRSGETADIPDYMAQVRRKARRNPESGPAVATIVEARLAPGGQGGLAQGSRRPLC